MVCSSTNWGGNFYLNIGCGLNLDNARPTISVNQLLEETTRHGLHRISREEYLARTFNNLENMLDKFSSGRGQHVIQVFQLLIDLFNIQGY